MMTKRRKVDNMKKAKRGLVGAIAFAILIFGGLFLLFKCTTHIPAGYVGVVYNVRGGVVGEVLTQGWHVVAPTKEVTTYSIGVEQSYLTAGDNGDSPENDSFEAPSSDGKGLTVDLAFTYRFDSDMVADTFTRFKGRSGKEILMSFIKPNVMSWTKEVTAQYSVTEILGDQRANLNLVLTEYLMKKFAPYGIVVENATLVDINPDNETRQAIQKKVTAQQELELANIEAQTAKIQAEKDKEVAEIAAEREIVEAEANAKALRIAAEAEADANKKIAASLTPELVEKIKYERWDGKVPTVSGSGTGTIVSIDGVN